jgi:hypothetical protein
MKARRSSYARPVIRSEESSAPRRGRAVRQGAAWPAERPSSWLVVREAVSRWQVAHRRAVMVAKCRRRCPQEHGGVAQRAPAGHGGQEVRSRPCLRQRVGVLGQRPESSVWCGCPASRVPVHAAAVRCGRLSVQMSGVRCSAWVSGVRGSRVHCVRLGGCGGVAVGRQPHGWDGRRRRGRLTCPRPVRRLPGSEPGGRGWRRSAGSAEGSAWAWPRGRWLGSG